MVQGGPDALTAWVGIPLTAQPGLVHMSAQSVPGAAARELSYTITAKQYREKRLRVAPGTEVELSAEPLPPSMMRRAIRTA
jgi:hypothetical protein